MRVVSVLGAVSIGVVLGSGVILAPFIMSASAPKVGLPSTPWARLGAYVALDQSARAPGKPLEASTASDAAPAKDPTRQPSMTPVPAQPSLAVAAVNAASPQMAPWTTTVVPEQRSADRRMTSSKAASEDQRIVLVKDLQAQLKRVGCYEGEVNGQWNASTKRAMATFTDRVNASLPIQNPDYILLTLVQGHRGNACGSSCPAGEALNEARRCVPDAIIAQNEQAKRTGRDAAGVAGGLVAGPGIVRSLPKVASTSVPTDETPSKTTHGLANLDGTAVAPRARVSTPPAPVAAAPAALPLPQVAAVPQPNVVRPTVAPLPGRMTVGAALPIEPELPAVKPASPLVKLSSDQGGAAIEHSANRPAGHESSHPRVRHTQPSVVVIRRPPPPQTKSYAIAVPSKAAKSRQLIYDMFQRPDRF